MNTNKISLASIFNYSNDNEIKKTKSICQNKQLNKKQEVTNNTNVFAKKVLLAMIEAFKNGRRECFDAHAMDFGCERRALSVFVFTSKQDIVGEIQNLNIAEKEAEEIMLSKETAYLVQCFFLRKFRKTEPKKNRPNEEQFIIDENELMKDSGLAKRLCSHIVKKISVEVSKISAEFMENQAKICNSGIALNMIEKKGLYTSDCFPSIKLTLEKVKELAIPILIKHMLNLKEIEGNKKSFGFLCKYSSQQRSFVALEEKPTGPIIVFEGRAREGIDANSLKKIFFEKGVAEVMLCKAALVPQKNNDEEKVQYVINKNTYLDCGEEVEPFFELDHVFCSGMVDEKNVDT